MRGLAVAGLMLASAGCDDVDPLKKVVRPKCTPRLELEGQVDGTTISSDVYEQGTSWFVYAYDEWVLDQLSREGMKWLGLDSDSLEDVARYRYFTHAFDLRVLKTEFAPGNLALGGRDLGIYFYDLELHDVQPGVEVEVFDISSIEALREQGDLAALGDEVRRLLDEMRDNGQPDVIVAFNSDRSEEKLPFKLFINLLAPHTRFASSGSARYFDLWADEGMYLSSVEHPVDDVNAVSVEAEVAFGEDEVSIRDLCRSLRVINVRD
jgi:hypothetical protein